MSALHDAILQTFERWTGVRPRLAPGDRGDLLLTHPALPAPVAVEATLTGTRPVVARAVERLREAGGPALVVVRDMPPSSAALCVEHGVGWLDLAGNADIRWPGFHAHVEGRKAVAGAKPRRSPFAPKAARIVRVLAAARRPVLQMELATMADIDPGYTSRVLRELERDGWLTRDGGVIEVTDLRGLLDAWRERHRPRHPVLLGALAARTSQHLVAEVVACLDEHRIGVVLTGLAAAWCYAPSVAYRRVSAYVSALPSPDMLLRFGFVETTNAPGLVLELNDDPWLWDHSTVVAGLPCADPGLVYADLSRSPERAAEASDALWQWMASSDG